MPNLERLFAPLHLGLCQDVFHYLKTRCCLFCWCALATSEVAFFFLYLFAELVSEARDVARAEQLLSSVAKIVVLIMF